MTTVSMAKPFQAKAVMPEWAALCPACLQHDPASRITGNCLVHLNESEPSLSVAQLEHLLPKTKITEIHFKIYLIREFRITVFLEYYVSNTASEKR
jgi:hypothetical protein